MSIFYLDVELSKIFLEAGGLNPDDFNLPVMFNTDGMHVIAKKKDAVLSINISIQID